MKRVLISVEGQTEETFVREVLARRLWEIQIDLTPIIIATKRMKQGKKFKGGLTTYDHARNDINLLLQDTNAVAITTMYDLYHLPQNFPGYASCPPGDCYTRTAYLEAQFQQDVGDPRFRPYLQIHEFEAFLFVQPEKTAEILTSASRLNDLYKIRRSFNSPEEINDGEMTAPSKRILKLFPNYDKPLYGSLVAIGVGLDAISLECPHFREWMEWLESI